MILSTFNHTVKLLKKNSSTASQLSTSPGILLLVSSYETTMLSLLAMS